MSPQAPGHFCGIFLFLYHNLSNQWKIRISCILTSQSGWTMDCCCKSLSLFCTIFNWKSACPPTCPGKPRPPTWLPFRSRGRWSGTASGWQESNSALFPSAASPHCPGFPLSHCLKLLKQHPRKLESLVKLTQQLPSLILYFSQYVKLQASKVKFLSWLSLMNRVSEFCFALYYKKHWPLF